VPEVRGDSRQRGPLLPGVRVGDGPTRRPPDRGTGGGGDGSNGVDACGASGRDAHERRDCPPAGGRKPSNVCRGWGGLGDALARARRGTHLRANPGYGSTWPSGALLRPNTSPSNIWPGPLPGGNTGPSNTWPTPLPGGNTRPGNIWPRPLPGSNTSPSNTPLACT
jgi:hypothetical protein